MAAAIPKGMVVLRGSCMYENVRKTFCTTDICSCVYYALIERRKYENEAYCRSVVCYGLDFSMVVSAQAAYSTMYVNCDVGETVRLRASASSTGTILTNIPRGTAVQAEYYNSSWHRVTYGNYNSRD